jgi:soluble lytic murein transglycosylase
MFKSFAVGLASAFTAGALALASLSAQATAEQDLFNAARAAYKVRDDKALAQYDERLQAQNYILAPYLDYWLMLLHLDKANPDDVQAFLSKYTDYPFADRVRTEWLKNLGRQQSWKQFFDELPNLKRDDPSVSCYAAYGRYVQGETGALEIAKPLWMVSVDQPTNCDKLYAAMKDNGALSDVDIWARMRLAFQANRMTVAKSASHYLSESPSAAMLKLYDKVYENPQRALEKNTIPMSSKLGRELALFAMERVARTKPALAVDYWNKIRGNYNREMQSYAWGRLALLAARLHDPSALDLYDKADDAKLDAEQLAWKVRANLRVKNWDGVLATIADMAQPQQDESGWRYWKGRALKEKNNVGSANALFIPLSREHSFYGILAEEELGDVMSAPPPSYRATDAEIAAIQQQPGVRRALELLQLDMRWEAKTEWQMVVRDFDDKQLLAAADLAFRQEWYDVAINTAEKTSLTHDLALRYPTPYRDMMDGYVRDNQLDEAWVYGLIRQESRFVNFARSGVGASGLMQVMPATAKWIAKRLGLVDYHPGLIARADTNIQLGTYYLRHVLDQMNGQVLMATAAYNAGPGRPKRWADTKPMEGAIYAETIPFIETRDYVLKVMSNAHFYAHRLGQKLLSFKQRIGTVGPVGNPSDPPTGEDVASE